jgi:membrane protease YdiL (CAAX protease family)
MISLLLIFITSAMLIISGLKKKPGIGILGTILTIAIALWYRGDNLNALGFSLPLRWGEPISLGLVYALVIHFLSDLFIEPLIEKLTQSTPDHSAFNNIKGNWKGFVKIVVMVWIFVAILEEGIYRGFLMTEILKIVGTGTIAIIFNVIFSSIVFGFSHGYQNRSGMWSTGIIGAIFGCIFVLSKFNLWVVIFVHGFLDTIALGLIAINKEKYMRQKLQSLVVQQKRPS